MAAAVSHAAQPELGGPEDPRFGEVAAYMDAMGRAAGIVARYAPRGGEIVIEDACRT